MTRKRTKPPAVLPGEVERRERAVHLLAVVASFENAKRRVPGHVLRELVLLQGAWPSGERIPECVQSAQRVLGRTDHRRNQP